MVPGLGLTVLGLAGVGLSLSGLARTFVEGMHAVSALMMFIGMIILAAGILKDGLPSSNTAKASVVIIIGFLVSIGAFFASLSSVSSLPGFIGLLFLILVPAGIIAYAAHKQSPHFRGITILFTSAAVVGGIVFFAFGFATPQPIEAGVVEKPAPSPEEFEGPKAEVKILEGASVEGAPAYDPVELEVEKGTMIVWTNEDSVVHSVTNGIGFDDANYGKLFDSLTVGASKTFALDTTELESGTYDYFCTFHPYMKGKFTIAGEGAAEEVEGAETSEESEAHEEAEMEEGIVGSEAELATVIVDIVPGAASSNNPEFYNPNEITVKVGTTVVWKNSDSAGHTVTSGKPGDADFGTFFDSAKGPDFLMKPETEFQHAFDKEGEFDYFCQVHPWMVGKVIVE
jgi:plastocyanin